MKVPLLLFALLAPVATPAYGLPGDLLLPTTGSGVGRIPSPIQENSSSPPEAHTDEGNGFGEHGFRDPAPMQEARTAQPEMTAPKISPIGRKWGFSVDLGLDYLAFSRSITTTTIEMSPGIDDMVHISAYSKHNGAMLVSLGALYTEYLGLKGLCGIGMNFAGSVYHGSDVIWCGLELDGYVPLTRYLRFRGGIGTATLDLGHVADNSCGSNCTVLNPSASTTTSHGGEYVSGARLIGSLGEFGKGVGGSFFSVGYSQYFYSSDLSHHVFISFSGLGWAR